MEAAYPHRIVKWSWSVPGGSGRALEASETAELTGTLREPYWKLNRPGDERYRDRLR